MNKHSKRLRADFNTLDSNPVRFPRISLWSSLAFGNIANLSNVSGSVHLSIAVSSSTADQVSKQYQCYLLLRRYCGYITLSIQFPGKNVFNASRTCPCYIFNTHSKLAGWLGVSQVPIFLSGYSFSWENSWTNIRDSREYHRFPEISRHVPQIVGKGIAPDILTSYCLHYCIPSNTVYQHPSRRSAAAYAANSGRSTRMSGGRREKPQFRRLTSLPPIS